VLNAYIVKSEAAPVISLLSPASGPVGKRVTINGSNFGGKQEGSSVKFNATQVTEYVSWSDTQIVAVVPVGATSGNVAVTTAGGTGSSPQGFTVLGNPVPVVTSEIPTTPVVVNTFFPVRVVLAVSGGLPDKAGVAISFPGSVNYFV
jgi:hypothetical protein